MGKTIIVFTDETRFTSYSDCRRVDRKETAEAFLSARHKEVRIEGEGLRQVYYFLKSDVDGLDKLLIHSPEKFCPPYPDVVLAQNHWKDTYALLKSMQKNG